MTEAKQLPALAWSDWSFQAKLLNNAAIRNKKCRGRCLGIGSKLFA